jgi:endonuclease/exonuclease/phosphatase family metal-dependent hydrolase
MGTILYRIMAVSLLALSAPALAAVKLAAWNIGYGFSGAGNGQVDLNRVAQVVIDSQADVIGLNEVARFHPNANCADQMAVLIGLLVVHYPHFYYNPVTSHAPSCAGAPATELGDMIFSKYDLTNETSTSLGYYGWAGSSRDVHSVRVVGHAEGTFAFHLTHLIPEFDTGAPPGTNIDAIRSLQASLAVSAIEAYRSPSTEHFVLVGDFNSDKYSQSIGPITSKMASYTDTQDHTMGMYSSVGVALGQPKGWRACLVGLPCGDGEASDPDDYQNWASDHILLWADYQFASFPTEVNTRRPSAVAHQSGIVDVFWRTAGNALGRIRYTPTTYPPWSKAEILSTPGALTSDPSPVLTSTGNVAVYWKGTDGTLWGGVFTGPGNSWAIAPGSTQIAIGSGPKALGNSNGNSLVYWRGNDNALWVALLNSQGVGSPLSLGGGLKDSPAVAMISGFAEAFVRGTDDGLWHKVGPWSGWYENLFTGPVLSPPGVAGKDFGSGIHVMWRGAGNSIQYRAGVRLSQSSYTWAPVENWGGGVLEDPVLVNPSAGVTEAIIKGTDNALWRRRYQNWSWGGWFEQINPGPLLSGPTVAVPGNGNMEVLWRDSTGSLHHRGFYSGNWQAPFRLDPL